MKGVPGIGSEIESAFITHPLIYVAVLGGIGSITDGVYMHRLTAKGGLSKSKGPFCSVFCQVRNIQGISFPRFQGKVEKKIEVVLRGPGLSPRIIGVSSPGRVFYKFGPF